MLTRLLLAGALMGAFAHTLPAHADAIYACVNNSSGTIKIVTQTDVCPTGSSKTSWISTPPPAPLTDVYIAAIETLTIDAGPINPVVAELSLPAGQYLVLGQIDDISAVSHDPFQIGCRIRAVGVTGDIAASISDSDIVRGSTSLAGLTTSQGAQTIRFSCAAAPQSAGQIDRKSVV